MGRGLSELQRYILQTAARFDPEPIYYGDILIGYFKWPQPRVISIAITEAGKEYLSNGSQCAPMGKESKPIESNGSYSSTIVPESKPIEMKRSSE